MSAWVLLVAFLYSRNPFHSHSFGLSSIFIKLNSLFSWSRRFHSFDKPVKLKYMFPHVSVKACLYMSYYFLIWNKPLTFMIIWATFSIKSRYDLRMLWLTITTCKYIPSLNKMYFLILNYGLIIQNSNIN